jgi:hypothetical protein
MTAYIPNIICAKCGKPVDSIERRQDGTSRFIAYACHGERGRMGFATSVSQRVEVFAPKAPAPDPATQTFDPGPAQ